MSCHICTKSCTTNCCKKKPEVLFFDKPKNLEWNSGDLDETIIFDKKIKLCSKTNVNIESTISAQTIFGDIAPIIYNAYKLYVDGKLVSQAGFQPDVEQYSEENLNHIETSSLTWSGIKCCCFNVKVTAQLLRQSLFTTTTETINPNQNEITSDIKKEGTVGEAKGAFLRINLLSCDSSTYFFKNNFAVWDNQRPITLFDETL